MRRVEGPELRAGLTMDLALIPVWVLLGVVVLVLHGAAFIAPDTALSMMGALQIVFGVRVFWTHGGRQLTAAGVYSLSSSVFIGFAAIWYAQLYGADVPPALGTATSLCYFSHVAVYSLFWRTTFPAQRPSVPPHPPPEQVTAWLGRCGAVLVVAAVAANTAGIGFIIVDSTAFVGIVFLVLAWLYQPDGPSGRPTYLLAASAGVALYVAIFFSGYGRLKLATLAIVIVVAAAPYLRGRSAKLVTLVFIPAALVVFGAIRVAFMQELYPSKIDTENGGIDSVINPLLTFAQVIAGIDAKAIEYGNGSSFVATVFLYVPRAWWADKPIGFGAVLAQELLKPGDAVEGTSLAALSQGEWFHNFGVVGIPLMVLVLGLAVRWLDGVLRRVLARPFGTRRDFIVLAATVVAVAGMTDLVWVGTFTFNERAGTRLFVILTVALFSTDAVRRRARALRST